jgi:phosphoglycerate dehydrogenase-like enzyme
MKIVVGPGPAAPLVAEWRDEFPEVELVPVTTPEEQLGAVQGADAFIGWITREAFVAAGPQLRWVHAPSAGVERHVAITELVESDVTLTNTRGSHAPTIAEHTFAMLLALTRRILELTEYQKQHTWKRPTNPRGIMGMTMTVVGFGQIGRAIAKRAVGFDMKVIGVDARPSEPPPGVDEVWGLDRLDEALREADVVAIAAPITPETRGMIDARRIGLLKPDAYLLVMSRGGIVEEAALIAALKEGRLAGAGLDVMATEPLPPDDPLWDAPNIILTPHSSGASEQTTGAVASITTANLRNFVTGAPLSNICDKRAGF